MSKMKCHLSFAAVTIVLFFTSPMIQPGKLTAVFLVLFSGASIWFDRKWKERLRPYCSGKRLAAVLGVSVYASFASFGHRFFLGEPRMSVTGTGLFYFLLGAVWFFPVCMFGLGLLETAGSWVQRAPKQAEPWTEGKLRLASTLVSLACFTFVLVSFYPGGFPTDSIEQFTQARNGFLNNWHPFVHTLMIRFLLKIWDNPAFVVFVQLAVFAVLIGRCSLIPYRVGVKPVYILLGVALFSFLPNQSVTNIAPMKDNAFTYAMLWATLLLVELVKDEQTIRRPLWCIEMGLSLALMVLMRHNGMVPMAFVSAALLILTVQHWEAVKLWATGAVVLAGVIIGVMNGPVYQALQVEPNDVSPFVTMFCAVGSVLNKDLPLSDETMQALAEVMPLERWHDNYSRFKGHDVYRWGEDGEEDVEMDLTRFSASEAFRIYFEALAKYPDVVIKDRLDGTELLWNVRTAEGSFNLRTVDFLTVNEAAGIHVGDLPEGTLYESRTLPARALRWVSWFTLPGESVSSQVSDMVLFRSGAWLIAFLILTVYWAEHGLNRMWLAALPLVGNVAGSMLVMFHQSFRYVWFVQVLVLVLMMATFEVDSVMKK